MWPFYAREKATYVTNTRSDGMLAKAIWKQSVAKRRCLVPVAGYYGPGLGPTGARGEVRFALQTARPSSFPASSIPTPTRAATRGFHRHDRAQHLRDTLPRPHARRARRHR